MVRAVFPEGMATQADLPLSPGIVSGDHLFVTGMTGSQSDGAMPSEPEVQFRLAFEKVESVLKAEGLEFRHVVDMTSFHVDINTHFDAFAKVHAAFVQRPYPAWTAVGVAALRREGALAEIKVVARMR